MKKLFDAFTGYKTPILSAITVASLVGGSSGIFSSYKPIMADVAKSSSLLFYLPFSVGDSVSINNTQGRVSKVNLQYVTLESKSATTYIPTHLVYGSIIKIFK
ncbi:hypothetical protein NEIG_00330 [Nematocida sp. ERTm5]|nr:hypothetical protein NEIRO02_1594 [Nematocida sp. AWRm79]KAI5185430.1 hypothetical protein NEIRO03_2018 [Nematocida sp. AWRm78]OAG30846.1 hypothetical protein NEIG_00330 [Nematocida sp. ERTm5]